MINLSNLKEEHFEDVTNHWNDLVPMMAMEECCELAQAISKYERFLKTVYRYGMSNYEIEIKYDELRENLLEEVRDVYISLEMIKRYWSIDDNVMNELIEKKLKKKY